MNTFKKLIFGLLLSGMALTVGCNDDKKELEKDSECTKEDICKGDLKCVVDNKGAEKGKCAEVCSKPADCTGGKTCDKKVSVVDGSEAKQCKAAGDDKIAAGNACTAANKDKCAEGTKCLVDGTGSTCTKTCDPSANPTGCEGATPDCLTEGVMVGESAKTVNICAKAKEPVDLGDKCVAGDTCKDSGKCLVDSATATEGVCVKDCVDGAACSTADASKPICATAGLALGEEDPSIKICIAKRAVGQPCTTEAVCVDTAECVKAGPQGNLCGFKCDTKGDDNAACIAENGQLPNCKSAKDLSDADVLVCQP